MTTLLTPPTLQLPADPEALALPPPEEHDRWLEMRRTGFGGSDAAAALGLNRYSSPYKLFCEKLGLVPDFVGNERTCWGKLLEDVVAKEAARRLGADTVLAPIAMYRSKSWPWMLANPDRFLIFSDGTVAILEVKTTDWRLADQWDEREGEAPVHHILQLMHYLAVTGLDRGHLVCLVGGNDLRMVEVHRDDQLIAEMADGEQALWDRICSEDAPPTDEAKSTTDALIARYRHPEDTTIELPADVAALVAERPPLVTQKKAIEGRIDAIDNAVREAIGGATAAIASGFERPVTWRPQDDTRLDSKALREEQPETWQRFARTKSIRVLRYPQR